MPPPMPRSATLLEPSVDPGPLPQCAVSVVAFATTGTPADGVWVGRIRRAVGEHLGSVYPKASTNPNLQEEVAQVVSELVTNALVHGSGDVVVSTRTCNGTVLLSVESGLGIQKPCTRTAQPEDENGRGLALVEHLSSAWGVTHRGTRLQVWAKVPVLPGRPR
ncbi:ATP-binding protein [Streptomyces sp. NPDC004111]|uniref:ATP-binding protein n=1 Tax=Streptomyces sp. NPDC004111 TaxID=3364690 RepID=UPI003686A20E